MRIYAVIAAAALLAGCSNTPTASEPEPTPPSDQELLEQWAGDVCTSADAVQATVAGAATNLDFDISAGLDQLPEIEKQVAENIDLVEGQIDQLQTVLSQAPEASSDAQRLSQELDQLISAARESGNEAVALLGQATSADNFLEAGINAAAAVAAAESAYSDASAALEVLDQLRTNASGDLGEAFAAAPSCG